MDYKKVLGYTVGIGMTGLCGYLIYEGLSQNNGPELTAGAVNTMFAGVAGYQILKEDVKETFNKYFGHKDKDITDKF